MPCWQGRESATVVPVRSGPIRTLGIALVFHDQSIDITGELEVLSSKLESIGYAADRAIHAGLTIRREDEYQSLSMQMRRASLSRIYAFTRREGISYKTFIIKKKET